MKSILPFLVINICLIRSVVCSNDYFYGPSVNFYPTRTPTIAEARNFDSNHRKIVPFNATAIAEAVNSFTDQQAEEGAAVFVEAGSVNGSGAGTTSPSWMENLGKIGRSRRILVTPLGKWGSCSFNYNVKIQSMYGVAFGGFNFTTDDGSGIHQGFLCRDCTESAIFNMAPLTYVCGQTMDNIDSWDVEFVNIVIPNGYLKQCIDSDGDTADFRVARNATIRDVRLLGCYFAPSFRVKGSQAHTDTFQVSGFSEYSNFTVENTVFFGSTNSAAQVGATNGYHFVRSLIIGTNITNVRYPLPPGADGYDRGYVSPSGVNGGATNSTSIDSLFIGSISASKWLYQVNSTISYHCQPSQQPASGPNWNVDLSLVTVDRAWIDARVPYMNMSYIENIFNSFG